MAGALSRLYRFVEDGDRACGHHLLYCLGNRKVKIGRLLVGIGEEIHYLCRQNRGNSFSGSRAIAWAAISTFVLKVFLGPSIYVWHCSSTLLIVCQPSRSWRALYLLLWSIFLYVALFSFTLLLVRNGVHPVLKLLLLVHLFVY